MLCKYFNQILFQQKLQEMRKPAAPSDWRKVENWVIDERKSLCFKHRNFFMLIKVLHFHGKIEMLLLTLKLGS